LGSFFSHALPLVKDSLSASLAPELQSVLDEELSLLRKVQQGLLTLTAEEDSANLYHDIIELRDSLGEAQRQDVPAIMAQMERLILITHQQDKFRKTPLPDVNAPYFAHMRIRENGRVRDLLLGSHHSLSRHLPCPIIDWKNAPISKVFYRYREGDEYVEQIGEREVEGEVLLRRVLRINEGQLTQVVTAEGVFLWNGSKWERSEVNLPQLEGGGGVAMRPDYATAADQFGTGSATLGYQADKHLQEITALIDPQQFEAITHPESGILLIQGGAGSGKTTVALHRLAYLMSKQPGYFFTNSVMPVVFGPALANYISKVLPSLGVEDVPAKIYQQWVSRQRQRLFQKLPRVYTENTPVAAIELKRHAFVLHWFAEEVASRVQDFGEELEHHFSGIREGQVVLKAWEQLEGTLWVPRMQHLGRWIQGRDRIGKLQAAQTPAVLRCWEKLVEELIPELEEAPEQFVIQVWDDCLIRKETLVSAAQRFAPGEFSEGELESVWAWANRQYHKRLEAERMRNDFAWKRLQQEAEQEQVAPQLRFQEEQPMLDDEDDTLLLLLYQMVIGPLRRKQGKLLQYRHLLVDEAQDFSPTEFKLLLNLTPPKRPSVTLAGDMDQRIMAGRRHQNWTEALGALEQNVTELEPLRIGYRSTHEVMELARAVIGEYSVNQDWEATRHGAPIGQFVFQEPGALVMFLVEALESLSIREPHASVAVLTRHPETANALHEGLVQADVYNLRRIRDQEFPFTPGIEVTDVAQTKGLEFDYVVVADADAQTYPSDLRSRHLLYVAVTRAAHQLWLLHCGNPSPLLPKPQG
jgi:DNA helicase-2/ATP-dependent DNA helicase PcrA